MTTTSRAVDQQLSTKEIFNILHYTSSALRQSDSGSCSSSPDVPSSADVPRKSWQSDWTPSSPSSSDSTLSSPQDSDGSENRFRLRQGLGELPRPSRLTQRPDFLVEAPGTPYDQGESVSSSEYNAAVHMELSGDDGLIFENCNTPSSSYSDRCCDCTARDKEIAILKAENVAVKAENAAVKAENAAVKSENKNLKQASHDRMIYNLFHDSD
jgi:hypothetical protein